MEALKVVNEWIGAEVIRFNPYALLTLRNNRHKIQFL